ncbi:MAG: hypothetical protein ACHQK8_02190 [Bacteroidia bacterium]
MSYRKFAGFLFFIISVLIANLATSLISRGLISWLHFMPPLKATLIGMSIMTVILVPVYQYVKSFCEMITGKIFSAGRNAGGKFFGLLWAFAVAFGVLFVIYLRIWFGVNIWEFI